jgi:hypothetical protein
MKYATFNEAGEITGRYDSAVHAEIPDGAIVLADNLWFATINEQDGVWARVGDEVMKLPIPELIQDVSALIEAARNWRDGEITRVDWVRDRHRDEVELGGATSITAERYTELLGYIQQLRDWPLSEGFPDASSRPDAPEWIASQVQ